MAKTEAKTNAMRMLDRVGISYTVQSYDCADGKIDGVSVAHKVGLDPAGVYKTLVTRGASGGICVFVIPVAAELDLKKAARAAGEKSVQMVHVDELNALTGYIRGGCSPVGLKKPYPVFFDRAALSLETITVSGGKRGLQISLAPEALIAAVRGSAAELTAG